MSIIELPIYETFPNYHSICNTKLKDISFIQDSWELCPTSSVKEIHSFLLKSYRDNTYVYTLIDSLSHINVSNCVKWKEFIYTKLQEEHDRISAYISSENNTVNKKHILSFLEGCGLMFSKQHKGTLSSLLETITTECRDDCLPYLCLCVTDKQEILSSCILYRYSFKQLIECSYICGNAELLFGYMLNQPEYAQSACHYTMKYTDKQTNDDILNLFCTVMSYGFQLRKATPYEFRFMRSPRLLYQPDKEALIDVCKTSFKMVQSSFTVNYDSFIMHSSDKYLSSFFSSLFYLLFKGNVTSSHKGKGLQLICILYKFKSSRSVCTYFDLFLFLLHHPTYCSLFLYTMSTIFIIPPCIHDTHQIDIYFRQSVKNCTDVNISCIGDMNGFLQYCIKTNLFSGHCTYISQNSLDYPSIVLRPLKRLEYINIESVLRSYLSEQVLPDCKDSIVSFYPHQLESIHKTTSIQFLQLRALPEGNKYIGVYTHSDEPSPIVYVYSDNCLPSVEDVSECIEMLTYSYTKIVCVVLVTPSFYFFIQLDSSYIPQKKDMITTYSSLLEKYNIRVEGKHKCQQWVHTEFTKEWNANKPFIVYSFIREEAKIVWQISIPLSYCKVNADKIEEEYSEIPEHSIFSDIGPFYQLDDPRMHKYNEDVYIYDDENIEDVNEQIQETEYSNALLFEQFNRYGIPEEEYDPEREQDTNKEEYYRSLEEKESYQLFIDKQYGEESAEPLQENISAYSNFTELKRQNLLEVGQTLTNTIKELVPKDEELGSSEDYLLHLNKVKEDSVEDGPEDSIYLQQMSLHL